MKQPPDAIIRCPSCGGSDIRRSLPRGPIDYVFMKLGKKPVRCRGCERRFYRTLVEPANPGEGPPEERVVF
ncbi:MAG TPA: hypothetical protein VME43_06935 [Bryobacteraceae bacterium]|nr:hypothetical protein [Bryobacteraceae bacterium]